MQVDPHYESRIAEIKERWYKLSKNTGSLREQDKRAALGTEVWGSNMLAKVHAPFVLLTGAGLMNAAHCWGAVKSMFALEFSGASKMSWAGNSVELLNCRALLECAAHATYVRPLLQHLLLSLLSVWAKATHVAAGKAELLLKQTMDLLWSVCQSDSSGVNPASLTLRANWGVESYEQLWRQPSTSCNGGHDFY